MAKKSKKTAAKKNTLTEAQSARIMTAIERGDDTIVLAEHVCKGCGRAIKKDYTECYACHFYGDDSFARKRNK